MEIWTKDGRNIAPNATVQAMIVPSNVAFFPNWKAQLVDGVKGYDNMIGWDGGEVFSGRSVLRFVTEVNFTIQFSYPTHAVTIQIVIDFKVQLSFVKYLQVL